MSRVILFLGIVFVSIGLFVFTANTVKGQYEMNKVVDKEFAIQNNCITHFMGKVGGIINRFFVCENELLYSDSITKSEAFRDDILSIKIRPYSYVSTNFIGTRSNVNSTAISIIDKNGNKIFEILNIDNELLIRDIKESLKKYGYVFILE